MKSLSGVDMISERREDQKKENDISKCEGKS